MSFLLFKIFLLSINGSMSAISVNRIITRTPKEGDLGLIFDINLINTANEEKELLEYHIRPSKECCVNLTQNVMTSNAGKIMGGSFGNIEPGQMKTVSVIWPTTEVFNRVGHCDIVISSTNNIKNEEREFIQQLQFDTRFNKIDADGIGFRKRKEYKDCVSWDLDFLNNCAPLNCEEKYFGKRNFFNTTTKICEPVAKCHSINEIYDIYTNECLDVSTLMNPSDIEQIKKGKYENNTLDLAQESKVSKGKEHKRNFLETGTNLPTQDEESLLWSQILSGLLIVLATVVVYTLVCFCIFILVNWLSKASSAKR